MGAGGVSCVEIDEAGVERPDVLGESEELFDRNELVRVEDPGVVGKRTDCRLGERLEGVDVRVRPTVSQSPADCEDSFRDDVLD